MKGEVRAVAGTKFARQVASQNGKIHKPRDQGNEIEAWNHRIDLERKAKKARKQNATRSK